MVVRSALTPGDLGIPVTSVRPPRRRRGVIDRDALVKRLLDTDDAPVVTFSAPAGYGKTTALMLWAEAETRDFLWAHLDDRDDDPTHLLQHIALACEQHSAIPEPTARRLAGAGRDVDTVMVPALGTVLQDRRSIVLVLDDVHHLGSAGAIRAIEGLIAHLPSGSQLVLSGRSLPTVALARRRLDGDAIEITATDLAMSSSEAAGLLDAAGVRLREEELDTLVARTEGWAGGLHLAALALSRGPTADTAAFSGRDRFVADYLVTEVLGGLPDDTVDFLCRSSVFERMSASLLDAVFGTDDSARRLEELEESGNLFLVPLDHEREWFRYHHLFAELLRARLVTRSPAAARELHGRASTVLEARGEVDGAIRHAIDAGDQRRAADLILAHGQDFAFRGRVPRLRQWLDLLDDDAMSRHPAAALAWAWYGVASGESEVLPGALAAAQQSDHRGPLSDGSPSVATAVAMVRAFVAPDGLAGVLRDCEAVRAEGGPETNPIWGLATGVQGTACSMLGEHERARELLTTGLPWIQTPSHQAAAIAHLALLDLESDDLDQATRNSARALQLTAEYNLESVLPCLAVFAVGALVAARRGLHEEGARTAATAERLLARLGDLSPRTAVMGYVLLARAALTSGDRARARALASEAARSQRREPGAIYLNEQLDAVTRELSRGGHELSLEVTPISPAELRVLAFLPTHLSLQEIAEQLLISRNTAKSHSVSIYRKLGVSSRGDAVAAARRLGLIDA